MVGLDEGGTGHLNKLYVCKSLFWEEEVKDTLLSQIEVTPGTSENVVPEYPIFISSNKKETVRGKSFGFPG